MVSVEWMVVHTKEINTSVRFHFHTTKIQMNSKTQAMKMTILVLSILINNLHFLMHIES